MEQQYTLIQSMRWYGPQDTVPLEHLAQAGCEGVVSALHHLPVGAVWSEEAVRDYKAQIEAQGMRWEVVESLPVHEAIKYAGPERDQLIENYKASLINLAKNGVRVITYNFMPVLDWLRTDTEYLTVGGARTLIFRKLDYLVFDLFLLQRVGAAQAYTEAEITAARQHYEQLSAADIKRIEKNILLALPGEKENFTYKKVKNLLNKYQDIDRVQLKRNLDYFLSAILPTAEAWGLQLAIHPDDPPFSILGLPRIMSTAQDVADMLAVNPSPANGLCFCTGSFGARADNDLPAMLRRWSDRVFFLHLRNTARDEAGNFFEAPHLAGSTNMYAIVRLATEIMKEQERRIPMRPDHGFQMLDDLHKDAYSGYSAIGRLKALAELRGLEYAIQQANR